MEEFLHFRLHTDEIDMEEIVEFLNQQAYVDFIVREFGISNREHIHCCIRLKCPKQTFVDRMKKRFPVIKGNKYYGLQKLKKDYDTNARYCYKGRQVDYPDIIQTIHTVEQWKAYYVDYWAQHQSGDHNAFGVTGVSPETKTTGGSVLVSKPKNKTFMVKVCDKVFDEYPVLPMAIWVHNGYKGDDLCTDLDTYEKCLEYLAQVLYENMGQAVKNLDDIIFERLFRGLLAAIIVRCPDKSLLKAKSKDLLNKFKHKL